MAGEWYPQPGMSQDLVNRILLDYLYQLREHSASIQQSLTSIVQQSVTTAIASSGGPSPSISAAILTGPFESRPATAGDATLYIETSRSGIASQAPFPVYVFSADTGWNFVSGKFFRTQAQISALSATLGTLDQGAVVYVAAPYCHNLIWSGSAWGWADPGDRSHRFAYFDTAPGDGWHAVDGTTFAALNADGSTTNVTPPDSTGANAYFLKSGAWTGATVAAAIPTMNAVSAGTPSGTNNAPALTMNSYTPVGTIGALAFAGTAGSTGSEDADRSLNNGAGGTLVGAGTVLNNIPQGPHAHAFTPAGTINTPAFTGAPATLTGTVAAPAFTGAAMGTHMHTISLAGGDPVAYLAAPLYYRQ